MNNLTAGRQPLIEITGSVKAQYEDYSSSLGSWSVLRNTIFLHFGKTFRLLQIV